MMRRCNNLRIRIHMLACLTKHPDWYSRLDGPCVETTGEGFVDITGEIKQFVHDASAAEGLVTLFTRTPRHP